MYIGPLDVNGNPKVLGSCVVRSSERLSPKRQILQSLISRAKQLGKSLFVLTVDPETDKVAHANYVAPSLKAKGADAREWSSKVVEVLGGKVCLDYY